jgi:hypothetical protein
LGRVQNQKSEKEGREAFFSQTSWKTKAPALVSFSGRTQSIAEKQTQAPVPCHRSAAMTARSPVEAKVT